MSSKGMMTVWKILPLKAQSLKTASAPPGVKTSPVLDDSVWFVSLEIFRWSVNPREQVVLVHRIPGEPTEEYHLLKNKT